MSQREKALARWGNNPRTVRFEEIDALLLSLGFDKRQRGSHAFYTRGEHRIGVPFRRPYVGAVYVKQLLALLDELPDLDE